MPDDRPPLSAAEAAEFVTRGMLRDELNTLRGNVREEIREEIQASESRTRVLIEDTHSMLRIILERLSDAIAGNAQIARVDTTIADVRATADAAASLAPRVHDHERRIRALEQRTS